MDKKSLDRISDGSVSVTLIYNVVDGPLGGPVNLCLIGKNGEKTILTNQP